MSKPIWTYHGDIAVAMEYALPHLEKAYKLIEEKEEEGSQNMRELFNILCATEVIRQRASQINKESIQDE